MSETQTSDRDDDADRDQGPDEGGGGSITLTLGDQEIVLRQRYELLSIVNEIGIAVFFTVGSIAFYWHELFNLGVTLFVIGSVQLGIRPAIRFARRVQLRLLTHGMPHEVARDF
ncbi:YrhK family protein [Actinomycetospora soli]|uniref:YrhK family protein n=1 Tax=Actinomycetospora soli TaxID=2893887 RepID=UPI001E47517B|nr:YrhK family protein [Actinomycetospora soli]MCD2186920.1 YrhK family protein [Actinomycetospora soli]